MRACGESSANQLRKICGGDGCMSPPISFGGLCNLVFHGFGASRTHLKPHCVEQVFQPS